MIVCVLPSTRLRNALFRRNAARIGDDGAELQRKSASCSIARARVCFLPLSVPSEECDAGGFYKEVFDIAFFPD